MPNILLHGPFGICAPLPITMSIFSSFSSSEFAFGAATVVVNLLVQTTLVLSMGLIAVWLVRHRGAALQSCVLRMTLVTTLCCPIVSWLLCAAGISGFRIELTAIEPSQPVTEVAIVHSEPASSPAESVTSPDSIPAPPLIDSVRMERPIEMPMTASFPSNGAILENRIEASDAPSPVIVTESAETPPNRAEISPAPTRLPVLYFAICAGWIVVSGFLLVRLLVANLLMERLRRKSLLAPENVVGDCHSIAQQMSVVAPPVLISERITSPCLCGWLRPAVMIPAGLNPVSADVLAHELAHLRRRDCFWSLLGHLTTAILPWQPLVWLLTRQMEQAADNVCDDFVVAHDFDRISYARELVAIAERYPAAWPAKSSAVGMAEFQSCLGSRVQRILDGSRTLSLKTGWKHLALVACAALTGTIVAGFLGAARNATPPNGIDPAEDVALNIAAADQKGDESSVVDTATEIRITGTVVKPDGTPAAGATVRTSLAWRDSIPKSFLKEPFVPRMSETTSDANGRFVIAISKQPFAELGSMEMDPIWDHQWKKTRIVAQLPGYGAAWLKYGEIDSSKPTVLRVIDDLPIRGKLVDLEGNPVSGANVTIREIHAAKDGSVVSDWLSAVKTGDLSRVSIDDWAFFTPEEFGIPKISTTDRDGSIQIRGLGKDRVAILQLDGDNVAYRSASAVCREMEPLSGKIGVKPFVSLEPIFGTDFTYAAAPSRPIEGTIVDAKTGEPLAGVSVENLTIVDGMHANPQSLKTFSDAQGRFRLTGMPKAKGNRIIIVPNDDQPYFMQNLDVPDSAGMEPVAMKIELHRGIWIKGRLTNKVTRNPIAGAWLSYHPFLTNEYAQKIPEFDRDGNVGGHEDRYRSDRDGNYRFVGLPGRAIVGAKSTLKSYLMGAGYADIDGPKNPKSGDFLTWGNFKPNPKYPSVMREINPAEEEQEARLDLEFDPGNSVNLRIVDQQGQFVKDAEIYGSTSHEWLMFFPVSEKPLQAIVNLKPDEKRTVIVRQRERKIGRVIELLPPHDNAHELKLELQPYATVTGRLVNSDEPLPGVKIGVQTKTTRGVHQHLFRFPAAIATDSDGRFRCELPPGCDYHLTAEGPGITGTYPPTVVDNLAVKGGERTNLGEFNFGNDQKFEPVQSKVESGKTVPEKKARPQANGEVQVSGMVLKPDGSPASGATVRLAAPRFVERWPKLEQLATPETNSVIADENGRFEIRARRLPVESAFNSDYRQTPSKLMPIAASLKGFGSTWIDLEGVEPVEPITLRLAEDFAVRGQVVDLEGNPVRGTTVTVNRIDRLKDENLTAFLSQINDGSFNIAFMQPWNVRKSHGLWEIGASMIGLPESLTTDNEGRLEIHGLGKDRLVHLAISGGDFAYQIATVASRAMETLEPVGSQRRKAIHEPIYGAPFKIVVPPSRPIEGTVVDAATGEPLAGVTIGVKSRLEMEFALRVKTTSDSDGRFRLMGLSKQSEIQLKVIPMDDQPYFRRTIEVPQPPGMDAVKMKIALHRGLWIKGRVTNMATHEPIAGIHLHYYPLISNGFAERLPKSDQDGDLDKDGDRYQSDHDGFYRLLGLPGRAVVGAEHRFMRFRLGIGLDEINVPRHQKSNELLVWGGMNGPKADRSFAIREINPGEDEREVHLDLQVDPGLSTTLRLVDELGDPVKGARVWPGTRWNENEDEKDNGIRIVENLEPDEKRVMYAHHAGHELGLMFNLEPPYDAGREITVVLKPLAKLAGRLLDEGEPMINVTVDAGLPTRTGYHQILGAWTTDKDGRFNFPVIPGPEYVLHMNDHSRAQFYAQVKDRLTFLPGEIKDLGDLQLKDHEFVPVKSDQPATNPKANGTSSKSSPGPGSQRMAQAELPGKTNDPEKADVARPNDENRRDAKTVGQATVKGIVLKPDGSPAVGATVRSALRIWPDMASLLPEGSISNVNETRTDASGQFSITVSTKPYGEPGNLEHFPLKPEEILQYVPVVASMPGFGPGWLEYKEFEPGTPATIRLVEDLPIRGRIVDLEGSPIRGVKIGIATICASKNEDLSEWLSTLASSGELWKAHQSTPREIESRVIDIPQAVTTDADGRFLIQGIGKERVTQLILDGGEVAYRRVTVVGRKLESAHLHADRLPKSAESTFFGHEFVFAATPTRPIEGVAVDAATGQPLSDVLIVSTKLADHRPGNFHVLKTRSDEVGRFRLLGMPKGKGNRFIAVPNGTQPYFAQEFSVPDSPGLDPTSMKVELHKGIWISGRVTDKVTHEPVSGVRMHYFPFRTNESAAGCRAFNLDSIPFSGDFLPVSDTSGNYRIVGLSGKAIVGALILSQKYLSGIGYDEVTCPKDPKWGHLEVIQNRIGPGKKWPTSIREIDVPADKSDVALDLELDPGLSIKVRFVDESGKPIEGPQIATNSFPGVYTKTDEVVCTLAPQQEQVLLIHHPDRKIGKVVRFNPPHDSHQEIVATLEPCGFVSGRLLKDGEPMPNITIVPHLLPRQDFQPSLSESTTDSDGRFRCVLVPGAEFELLTRIPNGGQSAVELAKPLTVNKSQEIELGDLEYGKDLRFRPVKVAQLEPGKVEPKKTSTLKFASTVLDPDGKPVTGANIFFFVNSLDATSEPNAKPLATSGRDGRFEIELPASHFEGWAKFASLVAKAPGFGFAAIPAINVETTGRLKASLSPEATANYEKHYEPEGKILKLVRDDVPLTGRVVNTEGQPISGVQVRLFEVMWNDQGNLDKWETLAASEDANFYDMRNKELGRGLNGPLFSAIVPDVATGDDGWFTMPGIGRERIVRIVIRKPGIQLSERWARTRRGETLVIPPTTNGNLRSNPSVYGQEFVHVAAVSVPVRGRVTDRDSGKPIAGACVSTVSTGYSGIRSASGSRHLFATTDENGQYYLDGIPVNKSQDLWVFPANDSEHLSVYQQITAKPGQLEIENDFMLRKGVLLQGRAVNAVTGEPIKGHVSYYALSKNLNVDRFPELASLRVDHERKTDADGRFVIPVIPGDGMLAFGADNIGQFARGQGADAIDDMRDTPVANRVYDGVPTMLSPYNFTSIQKISITDDAKTANATFEIHPAINVTGKLVDDKGSPVEGALTSGRSTSDSRWHKLKQATFQLDVIGDGSAKSLAFYHPERELASVVELNNDRPGSLTVSLQPAGAVRGRLLDENGSPLRQYSLSGIAIPNTEPLREPGKLTTDNDGRFEIRGLVPGRAYSVLAKKAGEVILTVFNGVVIESAAAKELGDLQLGKDQRFQPMKATNVKAAKVELPQTQMLRFAGTVVGPDGKPTANARIFASGHKPGVFPESHASQIATSDSSGRFQFDVPIDEAKKSWAHRHIFAVVEGSGFAAVPAMNLDATGTLKANVSPEEARLYEYHGLRDKATELRLTRDDVPLTGRIVNAEGQPVKGARVRVAEVWQSPSGNLDEWETFAKEKRADFYTLRDRASQFLVGPEAPSFIPDGVTTEDGRFIVRGVGRDRVVKILISGPGIEFAELRARTRKGETIVVPHQIDSPMAKNETYFGVDFVHVGAISVPVTGRVTDIETGKGIAGIRVGDGHLGKRIMSGSRYLFAMTDADGKYRLDGLPVNKSVDLLVRAPEGSLYLPAGNGVRTKPGEGEVVKDFQLRKGIPLQGRAVDAKTGKPIPGFATYYALNSNENLKSYPGFDQAHGPVQISADAEGRFTIPVIRGKGILTFDPDDNRKYSRGQGEDSLKSMNEKPFGGGLYSTSPMIISPRNTVALQGIDVPIEATTAEPTFKIEAGAQITGKVVDSSGQELQGVVVTGLDSIGHIWRSLKDANFEVNAFYAESPRVLGFYQPDRQLAAMIDLDKVPAEPLTVVLQPSGGIRGRLLDQDGMPLGQYRITGDLIPDQHWSNTQLPVTTDDEGRFEVLGLVPGREYTIRARMNAGANRVISGMVLKSITLESAAIKDVGDAVFSLDK